MASLQGHFTKLLIKIINPKRLIFKGFSDSVTWHREASVSIVSAAIRYMRLLHLRFLTEGRARSSETVGLSDGSGASIICRTVWSSSDRPAITHGRLKEKSLYQTRKLMRPPRADLTVGKLCGETASPELLPPLATIWNLDITGKLQYGNPQTK